MQLILMDQSRGFGPKMTPPPGRARPVFFLQEGLPAAASDLVASEGGGGDAVLVLEVSAAALENIFLLCQGELLCVWNWCEEKKMEDDMKEKEVGVVCVEREKESEAIVVSSSWSFAVFLGLFFSFPVN